MRNAKRASLHKCSGAVAVFGAVNVSRAGPHVDHGFSAAWPFTAVSDPQVEAALLFTASGKPRQEAGFVVLSMQPTADDLNEPFDLGILFIGGGVVAQPQSRKAANKIKSCLTCLKSRRRFLYGF